RNRNRSHPGDRANLTRTPRLRGWRASPSTRSGKRLVPIIERSDRELGDQVRRAASSIVLNLAEGQRSAKGNKHKHYSIAHGSANEVKAALDVACAWGWIGEAHEPQRILDRLLAILWRLTHPR
ncbi:MAG TPA: four helix bundle protein, partial [Kofleriaceae bacterium]|nr:four helix bundle protein [Kofleriaceae bacterium]